MTKVVVLCGGQGHRLRPLTVSLPKPLVELNGKPILQHIINFYTSKGFREFVLCAGYNVQAIKDFVSSGGFDANIEISDAGEDAGMLRRIYEARNFIDEKAMVTYGDTFINIDPDHILKVHNEKRKNLTITVADVRSPFGLVKVTKDQSVISFKEKPEFLYYIGHMVIEKSVINGLTSDLLSKPDGEGLIDLFQRLIAEKQLNAYKHEGLNITFNTPQEHQKAEEEFVKFYTEQKGKI